MSQTAGAFPAPTWTPPAREPFVPLRPLTLGQVLAGAIRALRTGTGAVLGPAIAVSVGAAVLARAVSWLLVDPAVDAIGASAQAGAALYDWLDGYGAGLVSWIVLQTAAIAAGLLQQGAAASSVSHAVVGRRLTPGGLRRRTAGAWGALWAWTAIATIVLLVLGGAGAAVIGAATLAHSGVAFVVVPLVHLAGAAVLAVLGTRFAFVPSAIVVERLPLGTAVRRSLALTRGAGAFWRVLGTRLLAWTMIWLATALVALPVFLLAQLLASIVAANGAVGDTLAIRTAADIAVVVVSAVIGAIGLVVTTSADALLYLDQRMRREGLDLVLARFLERERRPGTRHDPAEPDPYRGPATPAPAVPAAETPW